GFGLVDSQDARALVAAASRNPKTRWCVTALHPDGTAAAHACATGQHRWSAGQQAADFLRTLNLTLIPVIRGPCDHAQAQRAYRPSRSLRHLVNARNTRCTAPGCGRSAARCDLDHTTPWHLGGPTCPCNIAPLCRHHHRSKQAEGWWLDQPEPGVLKWRAPSGRSFATTPTVYPL
ncbi:MAG TPA: HNH endonuclease signature motif containing protein, partial [Streptosporangiaceae bacterium]|nr:HNH endonuclease signature motif containing protein [Streptosporangiaceae bacterium]